MKKILYLFLLLCLVSSVFAVQISDYPDIFVSGDVFNAKIVVGDEAPSKDVIIGTIITTNLAKFNLVSAVGTSRIDSDLYDITNFNAIVIGSPCVSSSAGALEGNPLDCNEGLEDGKGYVKVFEKEGRVQFLITGLMPEDRKYVAEKLAKGELQNINEKVYSISTGTGSSVKDVQITVKKKEPVYETEKEAVDEIQIEENSESLEDEEYESEVEVEYKEKQGFFGKIFSSIANFFKNLFR